MPQVDPNAASPSEERPESARARPSFQIKAPSPTHREMSERLDQLYQLSFQMFEKATAYENVVLVAGYAGFFALWSSVVKDIPPVIRFWSVGLMGISLVVYVLFHIAQMTTRAVFQYRMMSIMAKKLADPNFKEIWVAELKKPQRATGFVLLAWPFVLAVSASTGFLGGGLVAIASIELALK
ncbi:hypothetical protein BH10PSE1_BH10PSE1_34560 [soil metagenome]